MVKIVYRTIIETELDTDTNNTRVLKAFTQNVAAPRKVKPKILPVKKMPSYSEHSGEVEM